MKKRFKSKRKIKYRLLRLILLLIITIISFEYTFDKLFNKINLKIDNEKYINYLVNDTFGIYDISDIASLNSIDFILKYSLGMDITQKNTQAVTSTIEMKEESNSLPIVYIYNTHQTEEYKTNFSDSFNINNTVVIASYILKEYLFDLGINSIVEKSSIKEILNNNNWRYGASYKASRILLEQAKVNNPSLMYFFDIHRDSSSYDSTVTVINGKEYARVLFVVGLENPNYEANLKNTQELNDLINKFDSSLSRGILKKQGKGVNGIYNQDFNEQTFLIEIGGQYNNIEQINNTLEILAKVIYEYIEGEKNG